MELSGLLITRNARFAHQTHSGWLSFTFGIACGRLQTLKLRKYDDAWWLWSYANNSCQLQILILRISQSTIMPFVNQITITLGAWIFVAATHHETSLSTSTNQCVIILCQHKWLRTYDRADVAPEQSNLLIELSRLLARLTGVYEDKL